jgi:TolA-binding protein
VADFPETDYALNARLLLARDAMARGDTDEAVRHLNIIRTVYAASGEAAEALLLLGDMYRKESRLDEADSAYKDLVAVKEWKKLWPPALYGLGETARARNKLAEATAYFERIYVMYAAFHEWVAKAYLARADCLRKLHETARATETLTEMIAIPELAKYPEYETAKKMLAQLNPSP